LAYALGAEDQARITEALAVGGREVGRAVRANGDVLAPGLQRERQAQGGLAVAEGDEREIAHLTSVAVGAMEDAAAVILRQTGHRGDLVHDAGRQEELAAMHLGAVGERGGESALSGLRVLHLELAKLHAVADEVLAPQA